MPGARLRCSCEVALMSKSSNIPQALYGDDRPIEDILAEIRAYAAAVPSANMDWQSQGARPKGVTAAVDMAADAAPSAPDIETLSPVLEAVDLPSVLRQSAKPARATAASVHIFPRPMRKLSEALSAVRPLRPIAATVDDPKQTSAAQNSQPPVDAGPAKEVPRTMASFLDTRFKAMSQPPSTADTSVPSAAVADPDDRPVASMPSLADLNAVLGGDRVSLAEVLGGEGAAELLRPMLKQWLVENMPRIVEQALTLEMAENAVKSVRKA